MILSHNGFRKGDLKPTYWVLSNSHFTVYQSKDMYPSNISIVSIPIHSIISTNILLESGDVYSLKITTKNLTEELLGNQNVLSDWAFVINMAIQGTIHVKDEIDLLFPSMISKNESVTNEGHIIELNIVEASLENDCSCYLQCENSSHTFQTETVSTIHVNNGIIAHFNAKYHLTESTFLIFHMFDKTKQDHIVPIGDVIIPLAFLHNDTLYDEWHPISSNKKEKGTLHLQITLHNILDFKTLIPYHFPIISTTTRINLPPPIQPSKRDKYYSKEIAPSKIDPLKNGLFSGIFKIQACSFKEDLTEFYCTESNPTIDILSIPLSGNVTEMYPIDVDIISPIIWRFCFPEGIHLSFTQKQPSILPFVLTNSNGKKRYCVFLIQYEQLSKKDTSDICQMVGSNKSVMYAPVALCCIAESPLFFEMTSWLISIQNGEFMKGFTNVDDAFNHAIELVLYNTPTILPGRSYTFTMFNQQITSLIPHFNDIPKPPFSLSHIFYHFNLTIIVQIITYLLLGERIVFTSSNTSLIVIIIESFMSLMYPIQCVCSYIPILHQDILNLLETPFSFVFGLPLSLRSEATTIINNDNIIIVDIDFGVIQSPNKINSPSLPLSIETQLLSNLLFVKTASQQHNPWTSLTISDINIQLCFIQAFCELLNGYQQHIYYTRVTPFPLVTINKTDFINSKPTEYNEFLNCFLDTQAFQFFIENNSRHPDSFFNEWLDHAIYKQTIDTLTSYFKEIKLNQKVTTIPSMISPCKYPFSLLRINNFEITKTQTKQFETKVLSRHPLNPLHQQLIEPTIIPPSGNCIDAFISYHNKKTATLLEEEPSSKVFENSRQRYQFLQYFNTEKGLLQLDHERISLQKEEMFFLRNLFKKFTNCCRKEHDWVNLATMICLTKEMYIGEFDRPFIHCLKDEIEWENNAMWMEVFKRLIHSSKKEVFTNFSSTTFYTPQIDSDAMNSFIQKEDDKCFSIIHDILRMLKILNINDTFIESVLSNMCTYLNFNSERKQYVMKLQQVFKQVIFQ